MGEEPEMGFEIQARKNPNVISDFLQKNSPHPPCDGRQVTEASFLETDCDNHSFSAQAILKGHFMAGHGHSLHLLAG